MMKSVARRLLRLPITEYLPGRFKAVARAVTNPPTFPTFLQLEPTRRCNLRCLMCGRTYGSFDRQSDMTLEMFQKILCQFPSDLAAIHIQGLGEPLLHPQLIDMIVFAHNRGLRTSFNSNFTRLTDEIADRLVESGHHEIQVSIESTDPALFSDLRRNASLDRVIENIQRINEAKKRRQSPYPEIKVHAILMKHLLPGVPELVKTLKGLGVTSMHFIDLITNGIAGNATLADGSRLIDMALSASMSEKEIWDLIADIKRLGDDKFPISGPGDWGGLKLNRKQGVGILTCQELWERPFITTGGYMTPCCYMPDQNIMNMGRFGDMTFDEIWFGQAYQELRRKHITNYHPPQCANCQQLVYTYVDPSRLRSHGEVGRRYTHCFMRPEPDVFAPRLAALGRRASALQQQIKIRAQERGWRSAWTYTKSRLTNAYIVRRARWMRRPRVECPICGWRGFDFLMIDCGTFTVPHVSCPQCHNQERHRMLYLYLMRQDPDFSKRSGLVLHFAPEYHVRQVIDTNPQLTCISTDYAWHMVQNQPGQAFQSDMQHMPIADNSFDMLFCLHVLEHVPNDRTGISEMYRILKPGAVAYIMVPFMMGWKKTREFGAPDPAIFDHVRGYAPNDFSDRLAPFDYEAITAPAFLSQEEILRFRIPPDSQVIYRCLKRN